MAGLPTSSVSTRWRRGEPAFTKAIIFGNDTFRRMPVNETEHGASKRRFPERGARRAVETGPYLYRRIADFGSDQEVLADMGGGSAAGRTKRRFGSCVRPWASARRNILTDSRFTPWREEALKHAYASSIVFPLKAEGRLFGADFVTKGGPSDPQIGAIRAAVSSGGAA